MFLSVFRKYNILEFKNPDDDLSESVLWNVIGYAGFYISKFHVTAEDVTLTLFRGAKPVKLFRDMQDFIEPDETKGIYHITGWQVSIPIQIIVTTELEGDEYAGFRAISRKPRQEDVRLMLSEVLSEKDSDVLPSEISSNASSIRSHASSIVIDPSGSSPFNPMVGFQVFLNITTKQPPRHFHSIPDSLCMICHDQSF